MPLTLAISCMALDPGSDLIVNLHLQPSGKPEIVEAEVGLYFTPQTARKFAEALPHFRRAVDLALDNVDFLANLGAALASTGDLVGAVPVFEKALKLDPSNSVARDNLARARGSLQGKKV